MSKIPVKLEYDILHQQQISNQLSGNQVEALLNYFLLQAIEPICQTLWFKNEIAKVLNFSIRDSKSKVTSKEKHQALNDLFCLIQQFNKEDILVGIQLASFDRGFLQTILDRFVQAIAILSDKDIQMHRALVAGQFDLHAMDLIVSLENYFQQIDHNTLINIGKQVNYWFDLYIQLKNILAGKYYLYAFKYAKIAKMKRPHIDMDCLFKSLLMSIGKALDKYTSERGTLSSYVQYWFKSTLISPEFDFELGRAFSSSAYAKKKLKTQGINTTSISTDSVEFMIKEADLQFEGIDDSLSKLPDWDYKLIEFLDSIKDPHVQIAKYILKLPTINK